MAMAGTAVIAGAAAAGGALVALGASSVGVAREFESSIAIMSTAVSPESLGVASAAEAMSILSDASLAVGSDTALVGVSASGAADAITGLYKAGLSTSEIFGDLQGYLAGTTELSGALRAAVDLAAASELDMVAASELAAVTLATFGGHLETEAERAEFINEAMNNFVQVADASVASVDGLSAALVNVGPSAAAMGLEFEEVNTALGILSMRGIEGSEAGTALKSMLTNMMRDTPAVTGALQELGVSLYDVEGNLRSLPEIMGQFEAGLAGMTQEQRNQYIQTIAGTYGMNALNALLSEGVVGWEEMEAAIGEASTMQEVAAARTNTLAGAQEQLAGVWETFRIQIGTALIPVLTALADIGASLMEKYGPALTAAFEAVGNGIARIVAVISDGQLGELFTVFEDGSSVLGSIFEAFGMGETAANGLATSIGNIVTAVMTVVGPIAQAVAQFVSFKDVLIAIGLAVGAALLPVIAGIVSALAPVILAFAAVTAAVALLRNAWENNWGGIQEKVAAVMAFVVPLVQTAVTGIQTAIQTTIGAAIAWWNANWPTIQQTIATVWGLIQTVIGTAVETIRPAIEQMVTVAQGAGDRLSQLAGPLQELWAKVGPFIQAAATIIGGILTALLGVIVSIVRGIGNALEPFINMFVNVAENVIRIVGGIIQTLTGFFQLLVGLFTGNGEKVKEAWSNMVEGVKDIVGGLVDGVVALVTGLVETVIALVSGFVDGIVEFFTSLYDKLVGNSIIPDLVEDIIAWFKDLIAWIGDVLDTLWDTVVQPFIDMWNNLVAWFAEKAVQAIQLGKDLVQGIINGINAVGMNILSVIGDWVEAAINYVKKLLGISSPSAVFFEIGTDIGRGLIAGLQAIHSDAVAAMEAIFDAMSNVATLGGGFAGHFESQVLDPMREGLAATEEQLAGLDDYMASLVEALGYDENFLSGPNAVLELMRRMNYEHATPQEREQARALLSMYYERNAMQAEYIQMQQALIAEEQRLARLQEKQQQNAFLQEQLKLLQLIRDNNLSASILDGLVLGIHADAGALMDAMRAALSELIAAAEAQLRISSPSLVFRDIGRQMNRGLIMGLGDNRGVLAAMRESMDEVAARAFGASLPALAVSGGRTAHLYGGQHFYIQQTRGSVLDDVQALLSP